MTTFYRRGYTRFSKNGVPHQVSGTTVNRYDWRHGSPSYSPPAARRDPFVEKYPEIVRARRVSARVVAYNTTCPVCGDSVFYYQNEHGSRVFFDELGPPWPKHPCTDTRTIRVKSAGSPSTTTIIARGQSEIDEIAAWQADHGIDCAAEFKGQYGTDPWPLATIVLREKRVNRVFVVLNLLQPGRVANVFFWCKALPKCCKPGFLVAVRKNKISIFDPVAMESSEIAIRRYRGASAFFRAMVELDEE